MAHPHSTVHPIILPQLRFTDIFGQPNAYLEMNPSIRIDSSGGVCIMVRCVNYRKFQDRQFTQYESTSNSYYLCMTGKINDLLDLASFNVHTIYALYTLPVYPTFWTGLEDIRFVDDTTILATIPEFNPDGNPCIFRAELSADRTIVSNIQPCYPNSKPEKNWMPYVTTTGERRVIYSLSPFVVKSVATDDRRTIDICPTIQEKLKGYHGSTNGIPHASGGFLFLIHENRERTYHRWLLYDPVTDGVRISPEFVFFRYAHIEFPCSLAAWGDTYYVGLGVNDDKAFIVEIPKHAVESMISTTIVA
jgi:hypothetical protein